MKSKTYTNNLVSGHIHLRHILLTLASLLLLGQIRTRACVQNWYYPADYLLPRIWDASCSGKQTDKQDLLAEDWQKIIHSPGVTKEDIEAYLSLAKQCEITRAHYNSRWYYPSAEDGVSMTLEDIRDRSIAKSREGGPLAQRYALQAIRAMTSLQDYQRMDAFWSEIQMGKGVVGDMCLGYVARAWFELGRAEKALEIYRARGDLSSLLFCYKRMGKQVGRLDLVEDIVGHCPNHSEIPKMLQDWFVWSLIDNCSEENYRDRLSKQVLNRVEADRLCRISEVALSHPLCENPAMWHYVKALALDLNGRPKASVVEIKSASASVGTGFIHDSIRLMSIYLYAKTSVFNAAYEKRLLRDLQWLDAKIVSNVTEEVRRQTIEENWQLSYNISYYYWNDMLKKILLGEICPRMIDVGKPVLAIRLANMADNRLLGYVGAVQTYVNGNTQVLSLEKYRLSTVNFNWLDYSNGLFDLLYSKVAVEDIEAYLESLDRPGTELEQFLDERGYTEKAYFLDIAGTKCLRDMRYADAVRILDRVPSAYQYRLNTAQYMDRDPFLGYKKLMKVQLPNYKLSFAKQMAECERILTGNYGPDEKGQAMIQYGVGLKASFTYAWPLTCYSWSSEGHDDKWMRQKNLGEMFVRDGLEMIRDKEVKAQELLRLQLRLEIVQNYRGTDACKYVLRHCDEYRDWRKR